MPKVKGILKTISKGEKERICARQQENIGVIREVESDQRQVECG